MLQVLTTNQVVGVRKRRALLDMMAIGSEIENNILFWKAY